MRLTVSLYRDRSREGRATALLDDGQVHAFNVLGQSDRTAATAHGNPTRDPLKPFGNIPTGEYSAVLTVAALPANKQNVRTYGLGPRWHLIPISGDALRALLNGRFGFLLHGGASGFPMPVGFLRPTFGCLRAHEVSITWLAVHAPRTFDVTISEAA